MSKKILAINPGSTSTKLAIFSEEKEVWNKKITHSSEEVEQFSKIVEQLHWRKEMVLNTIKEAGFSPGEFSAIVARGGLLDPIPGGTYKINDEMVSDLRSGKNGEHASNLAGIMAHEIAMNEGIPAYTVNPVGVDEFEPEARLSGLPELPRKCQSHALNLKAVGRSVAENLGCELKEINLIGVHLGGGISIAAIKRGRIIDVNNANQGGPFSPERVGTLPALDLVEYIFREEDDKGKLKKKLVGRGGLAAYLGTNDGRQIEKRIINGDKEAEKVYRGMIYQIAKEIGKMAAVLQGEVEAIFVTGGLAHSDYIIRHLTQRVEFIAPLKIYPGSEEMKNLADGALRALKGEVEVLDYSKERDKLKKKKKEEMKGLI